MVSPDFPLESTRFFPKKHSIHFLLTGKIRIAHGSLLVQPPDLKARRADRRLSQWRLSDSVDHLASAPGGTSAARLLGERSSRRLARRRLRRAWRLQRSRSLAGLQTSVIRVSQRPEATRALPSPARSQVKTSQEGEPATVKVACTVRSATASVHGLWVCGQARSASAAGSPSSLSLSMSALPLTHTHARSHTYV